MLVLAVILVVVIIMLSNETLSQERELMRTELAAGRFTRVEGRVEQLTPSRRVGRKESFVVHSGEREFSYRYDDGDNSPGFHQTTRSGSPLVPMIRVRIADVDGRIARLEIAPQPGIGQ